ncbi:YbjN domain-containing protein [Chondromyces apiculatus]|uniref:Uncharacterized protein n=1 Tax=Chondromyces apiculatus DSM 436 TaxID=1192034 RepID=A0A017SZW3_9BACT|nr:hypothetical protein [Chondromyces apiculatus]EYF01856.1 Hypothetical protein CAP_7737 [Chondromyces apiculatus DSM 436]
MKSSRRAPAQSPSPPTAEAFLAETEQLAEEVSWPFESFGEVNETTVASGALIEADPVYEKLIWSYDTENCLATCMLVCREEVPATRRAAVLKLCALVNDGLSFGCLDYSLESGALAFRDHADLLFGPLDVALRRATGRLLSLAQQIAPAIHGTLHGKKPGQALRDARRAAEGEPVEEEAVGEGQAGEGQAGDEVPRAEAPEPAARKPPRKGGKKAAASKAAPPVTAKAWLFSLEELPGLCRKHRTIFAALPPACAAMPMVLFCQGDGDTRELAALLFEHLPEKGSCAPGETKKMFRLIENLERLVDQHCAAYCFDNLARGPSGDVTTSQAFHDTGTLGEVAQALEAMGVRVERTDFVSSYLIASDLGWLLDEAPRPTA